MSDLEFNPWDTYKDTPLPSLPIVEPPCKNCQYWKPHAIFNERGTFDGVRLCVAQNMHHDFSCYVSRAQPKQG